MDNAVSFSSFHSLFTLARDLETLLSSHVAFHSSTGLDGCSGLTRNLHSPPLTMPFFASSKTLLPLESYSVSVDESNRSMTCFHSFLVYVSEPRDDSAF